MQKRSMQSYERIPFMWKNRWQFSVRWNSAYGKIVVPLWNQMERFFPLVILGNKPRISTRSMVRECVKWFSNIPVVSVKAGIRTTSDAISSGQDCSICCPTRTTGFSIQLESAQSFVIIVTNIRNSEQRFKI